MKEGFRPCLSMGSKLFVNSDGVVYSTLSGIYLKPHLNKKGYQRLTVTINGKKKSPSVHRLVAEAFIPNPENKEQVNHIDGNKLNNHVSNLEWCTNYENMRHSWDTGLRNRDTVLKASVANSRMVLDLMTGIYYDSVSEAVRSNPRRLYLSKMHKRKCDFKFV